MTSVVISELPANPRAFLTLADPWEIFIRHRLLQGHKPLHSPDSVLRRPSYFWIATPAGIINAGEIPDYCGHFIAGERGGVSVAVKAPRLHRYSITDSQWRAMARGCHCVTGKGEDTNE